jgi:Domain of unknown function (DUF303).
MSLKRNSALRLCFAVCLGLGVSVARPAELRLGMPFSDHMVIQAGAPVRVWGTATPGETISVELAGKLGQGIANHEGKWRVDLPAFDCMPDHAPQPLIVRDGTHTLELLDVLIGEVWLCSGQSNMRFTLGRQAEPRDADAPLLFPVTLAGAHHPQIRLLNVSGGTPAGRLWGLCTPDTVRNFSAVGYHFGVALQHARDVPVGLIDLGKGGAAIRTFISEETFYAHPAFAENYPPERRRGFMAGSVFRDDLEPLAPFSLRGVLWYQGESDAARASLYPELLRAMIGDWRSALENPDLPFLVVQLPPWERRRTDPPLATVSYRWAELRAAQDRAVRGISATYLLSIADLGERLDIHPRRKREVGERLATLARASIYGESIPASGPRLESIAASPHSTTLTFAHTEGGLLAHGGELRDFEVAGDDGSFKDATAIIISHNQIVVRHPDAMRATTLRYAWRDYYIPTLLNGDGWPASPFQISIGSDLH